MPDRYTINDAHLDSNGELWVEATITDEEGNEQRRLKHVKSSGLTPEFRRVRENLTPLERKEKLNEDTPLISTLNEDLAAERGFNYRIRYPDKGGVSANPQYLYYEDFNVAFAQLDEMDVEGTWLEERVKDPLNGDSWSRISTNPINPDDSGPKAFGSGSDGFLPPSGDGDFLPPNSTGGGDGGLL